MTFKLLPLAAGLLPSFLAPVASADPAPQVSIPAAVQAAGPGKLDQPLSGAGQDAKGNPIPTLQFSANQTASALTAKASWKGPSQLFDQIALTGSVPLTSGATAVDLGSLDTMANGAWIGLNTAGAAVIGPPGPLGIGPFVPASDDTDKLREAVCVKYWNQVDASGPGKADRSKPCTLADLADYPALRREYENTYFTRGSFVLLWGVTSKVGYQQYKYFQPVTLSASTLQTTPWSVGGYIALQPNVVPSSLVTFSYQHQYGYDPGSAKVACPPGAVSGKGCVDGTLGAPPAVTKDLFTLDLRKRFSDFLGLSFANFAVQLTPSYDARARVWAIDAPLYFVSDGKGGFSGGLDVSWRSDKHETVVGVFLSKPFGLTPG